MNQGLRPTSQTATLEESSKNNLRTMLKQMAPNFYLLLWKLQNKGVSWNDRDSSSRRWPTKSWSKFHVRTGTPGRKSSTSHATCHTKNRLLSRGGFSPAQRVFGYQQRILGGLVSEGSADLPKSLCCRRLRHSTSHGHSRECLEGLSRN